ncbi:hypothetical protein A3K63_01600 [Candidatus Micrarchaeota archaeon RBG_16_49_10]|nr:MAG: hypothetical protein A3K63_01600 [Candidatus Micrarchaeota archaeon RBG_16_49_10]
MFLSLLLIYIIKNRLAIFWPSTGRMVDAIEELADLKGRETVYDLGSGDGRVLVRLAKNAKKATGIEHNPILNAIARKRIGGLKNVSVTQGDIFEKDLKDADVIVAYLSRFLTHKLEKKIIKECRNGTKIILVGYRFNGMKPLKERRVFLMRIRLYKV